MEVAHDRRHASFSWESLRVRELEERLRGTRQATICALNQMLDLKDLNTGVHSTLEFCAGSSKEPPPIKRSCSTVRKRTDGMNEYAPLSSLSTPICA